ncbi:unnamed protein product [Clavelina lepadiformis]|uniref:Uncharacterized protein n=1 Tax=Clavelina lepadiformis TaxID=159417 RepID=A0ABP0G2L3_CLALP
MKDLVWLWLASQTFGRMSDFPPCLLGNFSFSATDKCANKCNARIYANRPTSYLYMV